MLFNMEWETDYNFVFSLHSRLEITCSIEIPKADRLKPYYKYYTSYGVNMFNLYDVS